MTVQVSVVIPTHDRPRLLRQAVESVLRQRDVDLEVIVVDDGSATPATDTLAGLGGPSLRVLTHDRPRGVAAARNAGIGAAHGEWVALLDDDDLWAPDKVVRQLAAATSSGRDWVYAGAVEIDHHGHLLGGSPPLPPDAMMSVLRARNLMPAGSSNVVARTGALVAVGGVDEALRHLADWDLWLRLAGGVGPPAWAPAPLVAYRQHAGQATLDTDGMREEACVLADRHRADPVSIQRWAAWSCLRRGDRRRAAGIYAGAVRAGDFRSLGRAAAALVHPNPTALRQRPSRRPEDLRWNEEAAVWLAELA